jgi:hypothetical protein
MFYQYFYSNRVNIIPNSKLKSSSMELASNKYGVNGSPRHLIAIIDLVFLLAEEAQNNQ